MIRDMDTKANIVDSRTDAKADATSNRWMWAMIVLVLPITTWLSLWMRASLPWELAVPLIWWTWAAWTLVFMDRSGF